MKRIKMVSTLLAPVLLGALLALWFAIPAYNFWEGYTIPTSRALGSGDPKEASESFEAALKFLERGGYTRGVTVYFLPNTPEKDIGLWFRNQKKAAEVFNQPGLSDQSKIFEFRRLVRQPPDGIVNTFEGSVLGAVLGLILWVWFSVVKQKTETTRDQEPSGLTSLDI